MMTISPKELLKHSESIYKQMDEKGIRISSKTCADHVVLIVEELSELLAKNGVKDVAGLKGLVVAKVSKIPLWPTSDLRGKVSYLLNQEVVALFRGKLASDDRLQLDDYMRAHKLQLRRATLEKIFNESYSSGRMFPEHRVRADLGRVYVANFNYTNLAKEVRDIVIPEEGQEIWTLDVKNAEMVVLAVMSKDEALMSALKAEDFHKTCASVYFKKSYETVTDEDRARAKTISYAIIYGATSRWAAAEMDMTESEAEVFMGAFSKAYPVAAKFIADLASGGTLTGSASTHFGTVRQFESGDKERGKSVVSHTLQSTAGEIVRMGMRELTMMLPEGARMWGCQFDSYLLSVPIGVVKPTIDLLARVLEEEFLGFGFPFKLEVTENGSTWS